MLHFVLILAFHVTRKDGLQRFQLPFFSYVPISRYGMSTLAHWQYGASQRSLCALTVRAFGAHYKEEGVRCAPDTFLLMRLASEPFRTKRQLLRNPDWQQAVGIE